MSILNSGFSDHSNSGLILATGLIIHSLTTKPGSDLFPGLTTELTSLANALTVFTKDVSKGNAPGAAEARATSRAILIGLLQRLAIILEEMAPGDRAKLAHTGYQLRKIRERDHSPLPAPGNVRVMHTGNPGEARMDCRRVKGTLIYEARATQDLDSGTYTTCPPSSSKRDLLFKDLQRGVDWFFQIRCVGANGPSPWSDPAMMMVV